MSKVKKRIKLTREQAQEFNLRLDAIIEAEHVDNLHCDCELCRTLAEQAKPMSTKEKFNH